MSTYFDAPAESWTYDAIAANYCEEYSISRVFDRIKKDLQRRAERKDRDAAQAQKLLDSGWQQLVKAVKNRLSIENTGTTTPSSIPKSRLVKAVKNRLSIASENSELRSRNSKEDVENTGIATPSSIPKRNKVVLVEDEWENDSEASEDGRTSTQRICQRQYSDSNARGTAPADYSHKAVPSPSPPMPDTKRKKVKVTYSGKRSMAASKEGEGTKKNRNGGNAPSPDESIRERKKLQKEKLESAFNAPPVKSVFETPNSDGITSSDTDVSKRYPGRAESDSDTPKVKVTSSGKQSIAASKEDKATKKNRNGGNAPSLDETKPATVPGEDIIIQYFTKNPSKQWSYLNFLKTNRPEIIKLPPFSTDWTGLNGAWQSRFLSKAKEMPQWNHLKLKVPDISKLSLFWLGIIKDRKIVSKEIAVATNYEISSLELLDIAREKKKKNIANHIESVADKVDATSTDGGSRKAAVTSSKRKVASTDDDFDERQSQDSVSEASESDSVSEYVQSDAISGDDDDEKLLQFHHSWSVLSNRTLEWPTPRNGYCLRGYAWKTNFFLQETGYPLKH